MKVGLFIPCYIDAFFPEVGIATLQLLTRLGCSVEYPLDQTCCGQPMANSGCQPDAAATEALFIRCFKNFDTIVGPSGSCVHHVRFHLDAIEQTPEARKVRAGTRELVEFLHDDLKVATFPWAPAFPNKVGLHDSCTAVRGLGHARPSERVNEPYFSKTRDLLTQVQGLELVEVDRPDDCCGFGGSFCVTDEAVSAKMGYDRVHDFHRHGAEYIASADKSKSMLQKECGMTPYLQKRGIEVTESDLGERIQQLSNEPPSHIVVPAIHKLRTDVATLFARDLGTDPKDSDPHDLTEAMRQNARPRFLKADAGMTGANFAVAETGGFVVCTNEGNADIGASVPPLHVASIGIEKLLPRARDLGVFIRMLSRSALGSAITQYTSHFHGPKRGGELHVVLVDNTRSDRLGSPDFWHGLKCIRCGACMNTCPVYRRGGGLSYGATYSGPIGVILDPGFDISKYRELPFHSSLCGSCTEVCPVKIDISDQIYKWRRVVAEHGLLRLSKKVGMSALGTTLAHPATFHAAESMGESALEHLPRFLLYNPLNPWGKHRELPAVPRQTFRQWYLPEPEEP